MADYRELLRRAVEALPENNGAARRQVYEKARSALVAQLRAINPPLPAREITQHRLQLEDCIRQVEQQATDALLGGFRQLDEEPQKAAPAPQETAKPEPAEAKAPEPAQAAPAEETEPAPQAPSAPSMGEPAMAAPDMSAVPEASPEPEQSAPEPDKGTVEAALQTPLAANVTPAPQTAAPASEMPERPSVRPEPDQDDSMALNRALRAQANRDDELAPKDTAPNDVAPKVEPEREKPAATSQPEAPAGPVEIVGVTRPSDSIGQLIEEAERERPVRHGPKPGSIDYLIAQAQAAAARAAIPTRWKSDSPAAQLATEGSAAVAVAEPEAGTAVVADNDSAPQAKAMSSEREVDVETSDEDTDPQGAIDRAIETLDREARGEGGKDERKSEKTGEAKAAAAVGADPMAVEAESGSGGNAVTIFLVLVALLLAGVGGAGYWAWREGYIDFDAMFGQGEETQELSAANTGAETVQPTDGPGNTTATPDAVPTVSQDLLKTDERLNADSTPTETPAPAQETQTAAVAAPNADDNKIEERLPTADSFTSETAAPEAGENTAVAAAESQAAPTSVAPAGAQSLLLESSSEGTTGAVPFSGTVEWSRGVDELGAPTLMAKANIPARNLGVNVLIRRNSDPSLPASHLMEIDFSVTDSFVGGAVAGLPGVLLKNEELVRGTPLIGASARVVGNSFLFALSAAPQDVTTNTNLLQTRKWMDLALVYATGTRAIITLEKDAAAEGLFAEVMAAWSAEASANGAASTDATSAQ